MICCLKRSNHMNHMSYIFHSTLVCEKVGSPRKTSNAGSSGRAQTIPNVGHYTSYIAFSTGAVVITHQPGNPSKHRPHLSRPRYNLAKLRKIPEHLQAKGSLFSRTSRAQFAPPNTTCRIPFSWQDPTEKTVKYGQYRIVQERSKYSAYAMTLQQRKMAM